MTAAFRIALGEQLRTLRQSAGWTSQEDFAHFIGMDRTYVSGIERGRRNPTLNVIVRLAHGLEVPPEELLGDLPANCLDADECCPTCALTLREAPWPPRGGRERPQPPKPSGLQHNSKGNQ